MKFDLISDIHVDSHISYMPFAHDHPVGLWIQSLMPENPSNTIIVPGDFANMNRQSFRVLEAIKENYKNVVITLGNHDFYVPGEQKSLDRVSEFVEWCIENGIEVLSGNIIEIEGVKIGGTHMWYDGSFAKEHFGMSFDDYYEEWKVTLNDVNFIHPDIFENEWHIDQKKLLSDIIGQCDVVVTHVGPLFPLGLVPQEYHNTMTGSFCFDPAGLDLSRVKTWVFGHTHDRYYWVRGGVEFIANPLGYPHEKTNRGIITLEVE